MVSNADFSLTTANILKVSRKSAKVGMGQKSQVKVSKKSAKVGTAKKSQLKSAKSVRLCKSQ